MTRCQVSRVATMTLDCGGLVGDFVSPQEHFPVLLSTPVRDNSQKLTAVTSGSYEHINCLVAADLHLQAAHLLWVGLIPPRKGHMANIIAQYLMALAYSTKTHIAGRHHGYDISWSK